MKRSVKLIILLLVLALLGGAYALLGKTAPEEEETETASAEETFTILAIPYDTVAEMSWVCEGRTDDFRFRNDNGTWKYIPDESVIMDSSYLGTLADTFAGLEAYRELEMPEDISVYGLDKPFLTVTLKTAGGEEYVVTFGNATSVYGRRYCTIGDGKVYTVNSSAAAIFNYDLKNLVNPE